MFDPVTDMNAIDGVVADAITIEHLEEMLNRCDAYDFSGVKDLELYAMCIARQLIAVMRENEGLRNGVEFYKKVFSPEYTDA